MIIIALTFSIRDMSSAEIQAGRRVKVWYSPTCEYLHGTLIEPSVYPGYYNVRLDKDAEDYRIFNIYNLLKEWPTNNY